jgi:ankyrin repeat protein
VEAVRLALASGADVNFKDLCGYTALFYAALRAKGLVVTLLLEWGCDVNAIANDGSRP